jgi:hypothetical protein
MPTLVGEMTVNGSDQTRYTSSYTDAACAMLLITNTVHTLAEIVNFFKPLPLSVIINHLSLPECYSDSERIQHLRNSC